MHTGKHPGSNKKGANPAHNANPQTYTDVTRHASYKTIAYPAQGAAAPQPPPSAQVGLSSKLPKGKGR